MDIMLQAFDSVVWMAMRYANGRHTYAPTMVRDAIKSVQKIHPDWKPLPDTVLARDRKQREVGGFSLGLDSDWLTDLVEDEPEETIHTTHE